MQVYEFLSFMLITFPFSFARQYTFSDFSRNVFFPLNFKGY